MRALSASTQVLNPYRAGLELGESLRKVRPEVVFLFSSIHYRRDPQLLEGLHDGVDQPGLVLVGCSGDGWYEARGVADIGASALALSSDGRMRWHTACCDGVSEDTRGAADRCSSDLLGRLTRSPAVTFVFSAHNTDGASLVDVLGRRLEGAVVGGLAGDDRQGLKSYLYHGRRVLEDSLVMLAAEGDLGFDIRVVGDPGPVGVQGVVRRVRGTELLEIGDTTALGYVAAMSGKPLSDADWGISAFMHSPPDRPEERSLRSIASYDSASGSVLLFGGVQEGAVVQLCRMDPATMISEVETVGREVAATRVPPVAGLVVSCAGRKWNLGSRVEHEVTMLSPSGHAAFPLAGFPSFGEIAPRHAGSGYTKPLFHNVTYVLFLFQDDTEARCDS